MYDSHLLSTSSRIAICGSLLLAALASPGAAQEGASKIAVVDLDRVIITSPLGREMQQILQKLEEDTQAQLKVHAEKAQQIRQQANAENVTEDELRALQQQLEDENIAGRRIRDDAERQAKKIQDEGLQRIEEQLRPVFERLRDEEGYDLIINNAPGLVVIASPTVDITQKVLSTLGQSASGR